MQSYIWCSKRQKGLFPYGRGSFVLGIEETIKQIYNRDKYLKMELDMVAGYSWMKGESYGQKVRFAKS